MKNFGQGLLFALFFLFTLGACRSPNYLSSPIDFKHHVKGLILEAKLKNDSKILGEIIEVNSEAITLLPVNQDKGIIMTVLKKDIQRADIIIASTSNNPTSLSVWAGIINLAPIGHGYFLVLSVPINLVTTIIIGTDAAKGTYRMNYPKSVSWKQMSKFARFPQGIPGHIGIKEIK